jgi:uncharacterized caspase-like protein
VTKRGFQIAGMIATAVFAMFVSPDRACAQSRVALIFGNSAYQNAPKLSNPTKDATAIAQMFRDAGFDKVDLQLDLGTLDFKRAVRRFESSADKADIAVIYFAGHGIEIGGTNYLVPVDAKLASDRDAEDEAVSLERLVASAEGAQRLRLIILDACRDNPFVATMRRERKATNRAISAGLGSVEPTSTDTLIAYAAKAGSTAEDGEGEHSPFATAILKNLPIPGLDVRLAFGRVRDDVMKATGKRQEPFVYGSLGGGNVALVATPAKPTPQEASGDDVRKDFELVRSIASKRAWEVFLGTHPTGFYADLARAQIEVLSKQEGDSRVAALPQPPASAREPAPDALAWDKVKDSSDPSALQKFISRFPDSPLALNAQRRIDTLNKAVREREEAAQKAKAATAEAAAQKQREENERRAAAAEAELQTKNAEAARKAEEARQKVDQKARDKAAAEAEAARAAADKQAQTAEAARKQADARVSQEAACKDQQTRLDAILAKGSEGSGVDDLKSFSAALTCERLRPVAAAALDRFNAEAADRAAKQPNSYALVRAAQTELIRLGCFNGRPDGALAPTQTALKRYLTIIGLPADNLAVTPDVITDMTKHTTQVCPPECQSGETLKGGSCVADAKPAETSSRKERQPEKEKEQARRDKPAKEKQKSSQQARARPSVVGGGMGMTGVGF